MTLTHSGPPDRWPCPDQQDKHEDVHCDLYQGGCGHDCCAWWRGEHLTRTTEFSSLTRRGGSDNA